MMLKCNLTGRWHPYWSQLNNAPNRITNCKMLSERNLHRMWNWCLLNFTKWNISVERIELTANSLNALCCKPAALKMANSTGCDGCSHSHESLPNNCKPTVLNTLLSNDIGWSCVVERFSGEYRFTEWLAINPCRIILCQKTANRLRWIPLYRMIVDCSCEWFFDEYLQTDFVEYRSVEWSCRLLRDECWL